MLLGVIRSALVLSLAFAAPVAIAQEQKEREVREYVAPPATDGLGVFDPLAGLELETLVRRVSALEAQEEQLLRLIAALEARIQKLESER